MGRNKFGPQRGPWENHEWQGWWGDNPPFHLPLWESHTELLDRFHLESVPSPSGVTHLLFWRR